MLTTKLHDAGILFEGEVYPFFYYFREGRINMNEVMLDSDLAKLYKCKNGTKEVNQAVILINSQKDFLGFYQIKKVKIF